MKQRPLPATALALLSQRLVPPAWSRRVVGAVTAEGWILGAWASQRLLFLLLTWGVQAFAHPYYTGGLVSWQTLAIPWNAWDGGAYLTIARHGYADLGNVAYAPLYPALMWLTRWMPFNALLLASLAELAALYLLFDLVRARYGVDVAHRATLYLAWTPFAAFFSAAYTESLFLLCSVGVFWALQRQRLLLAGACVAAAALTRQYGLLLCLCLPGPLTWRRGVALALPVAAVAAFWLGVSWQLHVSFAPLASEQQVYARHLMWPWWGIAQTASHLGSARSFFLAEHAIADLMLVAGALVLAGLLVWRRAPWPASVYVWASILVILCLPIDITAVKNIDALASAPRYLMVLFPLALPAAQWAKTPARQRVIMLPLMAAVVLFTIFFVAGIWLG